jgi:hypothetical protein
MDRRQSVLPLSEDGTQETEPMQWDIGEQFDAPPAVATTERQIMPVGKHLMIVKHAEEGPNEYKRSDDNPDGMCLKLRLSDLEGRFKFVFDDLPQSKSLAWRAKQLAAAIGIVPHGETLSLTPDDVIGQTIEVELSHYTSKAGKLSATVKRYIERTSDALPKAAAKPRTQAARVTEMLDDDVVAF